MRVFGQSENDISICCLTLRIKPAFGLLWHNVFEGFACLPQNLFSMSYKQDTAERSAVERQDMSSLLPLP